MKPAGRPSTQSKYKDRLSMNRDIQYEDKMALTFPQGNPYSDINGNKWIAKWQATVWTNDG